MGGIVAELGSYIKIFWNRVAGSCC